MTMAGDACWDRGHLGTGCQRHTTTCHLQAGLGCRPGPLPRQV